VISVVDFDEVNQLLFRHSAVVKVQEKKWEYSGAVRQLFIDQEVLLFGWVGSIIWHFN
jgi:hypothetical protein